MGPEELTFAVAVELLREMKANGGIGRISRRLKRTRHYFTKWRKEFSLARFTTLAQALETMGIHPAGFFVRALANHAPCGDHVAELAAELLDTEAEDMSPELDIVIEALADTLRDGSSEGEGEPAATPTAEDELLARFALRWALRGQESGELGREWLAEMDEIRYSDAPAVIAAISERAEEIEPEKIPLAAGVVGSALRHVFEFDRAERIANQGLAYADEVLDHSAAGDLHLRLTMIKWDKGEASEAFAQNCAAFARYQEGGNSLGVAKAMVHRGCLFTYSGELKRSNAAFFQALSGLPDDELKGRFAAYTNLSLNHLNQGDTNSAIRFASEAERIPTDPLSKSKLTWLMGGILAEAGQHAESLAKLSRAQATLRRLAPVDSALVTIDKCEVFLQAGKPAEAYREARTMLEFVEPLRARTPLAEAAAVELASAGSRGEGLTFAALEAARARVKARPIRR